jgi:PKD repeat protein
MIGVLMLISIFAVVAGVVAVMYFSSPLPDKSPAVNLMVSNQSRIINLVHAGGDALPADKLQIYVDGTLRPFTGLGSDNTWSLGETLTYTVSSSDPMPTKVDVVYTGSQGMQWRGTSSFLLASLFLGTQTSFPQDVTLYTITATAGVGGIISPSGAVQVASGSPATFTITPNSGYTILDVMVNGSYDQGPVSSYTFLNVTMGQSISATFKAVATNTFSINVTAGPGGTVTPGNQTVSFGANQTFTITPNSGYLIGSVVVNGTPVIPVPSSYTFTNVTTNQTLAATFSSNFVPGCIANYYLGQTWTINASTNIASRIHFADTASGYASDDPNDWAMDIIARDDNFSVNFTGYILISQTDDYTFYLTSDDGSWLNLNGAQIINNGGLHSPTMVQTTVHLTPGYYSFALPMFENTGGCVAYLEYSSPNITRTFNLPYYHNPVTLPTASFTGSPLSGNAPLAVQFNDTSLDATTWVWNFGDGSPVSYLQNPTHTYTSIGTYNVTLLAANSFGSSMVTQNNYITVGSYVPGFLASYYYGQTWTFLAGMRTDPEIRFSDNSSQPGEPSDEINWAIPMTGRTTNFSVTWDGYLLIAASDSYTFSLRSDDGSSLAIDGTTLITDLYDHAPTTFTGTTYLTPGYHHLIVKMYQNGGYAVARLQYSNTTMPLQQVTNVWHVAVIYPPVAGFSATPLTGNAPLTVSFTDTSSNTPTSWSWNFGDGDTTNSTVQNPVHRYAAAGNYTVALTAANAAGSNTATSMNYITITALPTITGISPASGPASGGTVVNITGTNFAGTTSVTIGGTAATNVSVISTSSITAITPAHTAGTVNVVITTPNGTATGTGAYTYAAVPAFTSIAPTTGPITGSTAVMITGTNLLGATAVTFGGTAATGVSVVNATSITATTPAHTAGAVDVVITTPNGTATGTGAYTYGAVPTFTSITPNSGTPLGGTSVAIAGGNLIGANAGGIYNVTIGGSLATLITVNATSITATTPAHASGAVNVVITTPNGTATPTGTYTYDAVPTATIVSPSTGTPNGGQTITITGTNFGSAGPVTVKINGVAQSSPTWVNSTAITAVTIAGTGTSLPVVVTIADGQSATATGTFTYAYTYVNWTASTTWTVPAGITTVQYLVVGGGGGGGRYGGGGGGGGVLTGTTSVTPGTSVTVTVGSGGPAGNSTGGGNTGEGSNGVSSSFAPTGFATITAIGGGGGGSYYTTTAGNHNGNNGGSGGGAVGAGSTVGLGTQGNAGGLGLSWPTTPAYYMGGGGGGAGSAGLAATGTATPYKGGTGGAGQSYLSMTGTSTLYAGGGGGGGSNNGASTGGTAGTGGGGAGAVGGTNGGTGTANTGGGGGGGGSTGNGGAGGSGIVIIKY